MGTSTKRFGTGKREGHDSSAFYARGLSAPTWSTDTAVAQVPGKYLDRVFEHSSEDMRELPDNSIPVMVTSPPYHAGKNFDTDDTFEQFLAMLRRVLAETLRVLEPGGRAVINVANLGRRPYVPLASMVTAMACEIGFFPRGEIIWVKASGASSNCAWGSWCSASNPTLRDLHEYCLCFSKGRMDRARRGRSTIESDEFMAATLSVWHLPAESARRVGHPAPFPVALPRRFIELYSYAGDVILDPFMGSGSTAVAAVDAGRRFVGYDVDNGYARMARRRVRQAKAAAASSAVDGSPPAAVDVADTDTASPSQTSSPSAPSKPLSTSARAVSASAPQNSPSSRPVAERIPSSS
ncbi:MAG: site-specific DNA-methyltransferase [Actinomycetota bacterium]|nr:site-specific DNA-methyltransferase [Actinomycetota bacterium]